MLGCWGACKALMFYTQVHALLNSLGLAHFFFSFVFPKLVTVFVWVWGVFFSPVGGGCFSPHRGWVFTPFKTHTQTDTKPTFPLCTFFKLHTSPLTRSQPPADRLPFSSSLMPIFSRFSDLTPEVFQHTSKAAFYSENAHSHPSPESHLFGRR